MQFGDGNLEIVSLTTQRAFTKRERPPPYKAPVICLYQSRTLFPSVLPQRIISTSNTYCRLDSQPRAIIVRGTFTTAATPNPDLAVTSLLVYQISEDTYIQPRSVNLEYSPGRPTASSNTFLAETADIHNSYGSATES